jgi:hypothetical protein
MPTAIDMSVAWEQSRYDKGETEAERTAYINCPMTKDEYEAFIDALLAADKTEFPGETAGYFDGCLPIEVMAERGRETLRHGPMKPVGLTNPHKPAEKPYAVVQLRRDNKLGTLYNIVGFQTKMKYGAQTDVFRMIPGLQDASFARLGGIHRNTFINSPTLLDEEMRLRSRPISASPARSPASRAMSKAPRWGFWRAHGRGRDHGTRPAPRAPHHGHGRAHPPHHRRRGGQDLPADEREFRPLPPARRAQGRAARAARPLQGLYRPGQGRLAGLARRPRRRRRMIWTAGGRPR